MFSSAYGSFNHLPLQQNSFKELCLNLLSVLFILVSPEPTHQSFAPALLFQAPCSFYVAKCNGQLSAHKLSDYSRIKCSLLASPPGNTLHLASGTYILPGAHPSQWSLLFNLLCWFFSSFNIQLKIIMKYSFIDYSSIQ